MSEPWTHIHRLRKYRRKLARAFIRGQGYDKLAILKWRYWMKLNHQHANLWELD